jgi:mannose-6-phosphate isomerase
VLSDVVQLPFLLKVLAAASPLSLQAHPSLSQAALGFARENSLGIPVDAPNRNYRDELHKPELIFALTPFRALCGFRSAAEIGASIERLLEAAPGDSSLSGWLDRLGSDSDLRDVFEWLISRGPGVAELVDRLVEVAPLVDGPHYSLVAELATAFPADPGIAISLMLNLAVLEPGEVLFLPAGNIHAYVEGLGIELMAASDNVLRGGLTPKHVDVPELLSVLDFTPVGVPYLRPIPVSAAVEVFRPEVPEFELVHVTGDASLSLPGDAVLLCTSGSFAVNGTAVERGAAFFVSADESPLAITGSGALFVATPGAR